MVASASWEFERRALIRDTWGSLRTNQHGQAIKYVFFVGNDHKASNQAKLNREFEKFGDEVEEDFDETYRNLTLETLGQLK